MRGVILFIGAEANIIHLPVEGCSPLRRRSHSPNSPWFLTPNFLSQTQAPITPRWSFVE